MTFDVTDKKYQLSDQFAPDKESIWPNPPEKDGWVYAHNSLRSEMADMIVAMEAVKQRGAITAWEIDCVQKFWNAHWEHIYNHHRNEDVILVPVLKTRFKYPDKYEADHSDLDKMLEKLKSLFENISEGSGVDEIVKLLKEYEEMMKPHLLQEEVESLPLMRAYFGPEEIGPTIQEIIANGPKYEMGSIIIDMGIDKFRTEFMPQEGIPDFLWESDFIHRVNVFKQDFKLMIEAVKLGEKPKVSTESENVELEETKTSSENVLVH